MRLIAVLRRPLALSAILAPMTSIGAAAQQQADIEITKVLAPSGDVSLNGQLTPEIVIRNNGPSDASQIIVGFTIADPSAQQIVFQEQVQVPPLTAGDSVTVSATGSWTAAPAGRYGFSVSVLFEFETDPTNNQQQFPFDVVEDPGMLTLAEAVDILNSEVLDAHPLVDQLQAIHVSPTANEADSVIPPGQVITTVDNNVNLSYDHPVYLFFVDLYPGVLFSHPVEFVTVHAMTGDVVRTAAEFWPEIDGVTPTFGPACFDEPNPRRVRGNGQPCAPKENRYQPVETNDPTQWAVLVVGKLNKDVEKSTVDHDICKWKERINGNQTGPQVTGPNISTHFGTDNCGLTKKELCDALEPPDDERCEKVHFKYIGHGLREGLVVWDSTRSESEIMPWSELAGKLKALGASEYCIEITACHSGAAIRAFADSGIKGTVITSSSSSDTTLVGPGTGTPWERALEACAKDPSSDLDESGKTSPCELYAWVKELAGDSVVGVNPQLAKLGDTATRVQTGTREVPVRGETMQTNAGSIRVFFRQVCLATKKGRERPRIVWRGKLYLHNTTGNPKQDNRYCYRAIALCGTSRADFRRDTIFDGYKPNVAGNQTICIGDVKSDCRRVIIERYRPGIAKKEEYPVPFGLEDSVLIDLVPLELAVNPGERLLFHVSPDSLLEEGESYAAFLDAGSWSGTIGPAEFTVPPQGVDMTIGLEVPTDAEGGRRIPAYLRHRNRLDSTGFELDLLLADTIEAGSTNSGPHHYSNIVLRRGMSGAIEDGELSDSRVHRGSGASMSIIGNMRLTRVTIEADSIESAPKLLLEANDTARLEHVLVSDIDSALVIDGGIWSIDGLTVGNSATDGLKIRGSSGTRLRTFGMEKITVIDAAGDGLVLEGAGRGFDPLVLQDLVVEDVGGSDLALRSASSVVCLNCIYDDANTTVESGSILRRNFTVSVGVSDTAGQPVEGASVVATRLANGDTAWSMTTGPEGFATPASLTYSLNTGSGAARYAPWVITATAGDLKGVDTVSATGFTQVLLTLNQPLSSTPYDAATGSSLGAIRVSPHPIRRGDGVRIRVDHPEHLTGSPRVFDAAGHEITGIDWHRTTNGIVAPAFGEVASSGTYFVRLADDATARIVVE